MWLGRVRNYRVRERSGNRLSSLEMADHRVQMWTCGKDGGGEEIMIKRSVRAEALEIRWRGKIQKGMDRCCRGGTAWVSQTEVCRRVKGDGMMCNDVIQKEGEATVISGTLTVL